MHRVEAEGREGLSLAGSMWGASLATGSCNQTVQCDPPVAGDLAHHESGSAAARLFGEKASLISKPNNFHLSCLFLQDDKVSKASAGGKSPVSQGLSQGFATL